MAIERELKYKLTKLEHKRLLRSLKIYPQEIETHTNYYFDDEKLRLRRKKIGVRIRLLNKKKAVLTIKSKGQKTGIRGYKIRKEMETAIPLRIAKPVITGKKNLHSIRYAPLRALKLPPKVSCLGSLKNKRYKVRVPEGYLLEIDNSEFLGRKIYELELETKTPRRANQYIKKLLNQNRITFHPSEKSKLAQFLSALRSRRQKKRPNRS